MAKKVRDEADLWRSQRHKSKYGWDSIADDGGTFELVRGRDFEATTESARVQAHGWAKRHGYRAQTHVKDNSLFVKFIPRED